METQEELKNRRAEPDLRVINATLGFWWILAGRGSLHSERTLPKHVLFFFSFSFSPMASLKARSLWRGNVLFSWGRYFVCSLEATLPLESSQKNTAAQSPLPPSLSFAVPPCPPYSSSLHSVTPAPSSSSSLSTFSVVEHIAQHSTNKSSATARVACKTTSSCSTQQGWGLRFIVSLLRNVAKNYNSCHISFPKALRDGEEERWN